MFTEGFIKSVKEGLLAVRNFSYEVEDALDMRDMQGAQRAMLMMAGQALNCQSALTAKFTYEVSESENKTPKDNLELT